MSERSHLTRRGFTLGAVGLGAAALVPATTARASAAEGPDWARRATQTYDSLRRYFAADDGSGLYREHYPVSDEDPEYSYEWPFSQAHAAALDLSGLPAIGRRYRDDVTAHDRAQQHYYDEAGSTGLPGFASAPTAPYAQGGDFFYDDNEWVGLIDVQRHGMYGDRASLAEAKMIFDLVVSGWDDDPSHTPRGGVFWTQASWSTDRNTVSNMPGAELGGRLFEITGQRRYLDWALRMYRWTNDHLQTPEGLFHDHLSLTGEVEKTIWSYNQGVPVGVNTVLHQVTGRRRYLDEARRIAAAAADFYAEPDPDDAEQSRLDGQPPFFNSIYFKNLLKLESVTGGTTALRAMRAYATRMWDTRRDPATGLFRFGTDDSTQMIEQAAMVQVFAVLGWPRRRHHLLY